MLTFGAFALADYNIYGVGMMEVGTFYALCKIYLSAWDSLGDGWCQWPFVMVI